MERGKWITCSCGWKGRNRARILSEFYEDFFDTEYNLAKLVCGRDKCGKEHTFWIRNRT